MNSKSEEGYNAVVTKLLQTFVAKFIQILDQNSDVIFQSTTVKSDQIRDISADSACSNRSNTQGAFVKRLLKIQKVLKMMERTVQPKQHFSVITAPLCHLLKESLMSTTPKAKREEYMQDLP